MSYLHVYPPSDRIFPENKALCLQQLRNFLLPRNGSQANDPEPRAICELIFKILIGSGYSKKLQVSENNLLHTYIQVC